MTQCSPLGTKFLRARKWKIPMAEGRAFHFVNNNALKSKQWGFRRATDVEDDQR